MPIPEEDNHTSENFGSHEDDKSEEQDIERDYRNSVGENSDTRSCARDSLSRCTLQDRLLANELSVSLKEVKFSEQELPISKPVSDMKYPYLDSQNNNLFHSFNN